VAEGCSRARLLLEAGKPLGVSGGETGQDFDRDLTPERRVTSAIDFAHAAGSEA